MSLAVTNSKQYYLDLEKKDNLWDKLDQSEDMTSLRHAFVCPHLAGVPSVLDYGCGGGQLFSSLDFPLNAPQQYIGADFIRSREPVFLQAAKEANVNARFVLVEDSYDHLASMKQCIVDNPCHTLVICGVLGYEGFTDLPTIVSVIKEAHTGKAVITVPTEMARVGEVIHRFAEKEVEALGGVKLFTGLWGLVL